MGNLIERERDKASVTIGGMLSLVVFSDFCDPKMHHAVLPTIARLSCFNAVKPVADLHDRRSIYRSHQLSGADIWGRFLAHVSCTLRLWVKCLTCHCCCACLMQWTTDEATDKNITFCKTPHIASTQDAHASNRSTTWRHSETAQLSHIAEYYRQRQSMFSATSLHLISRFLSFWFTRYFTVHSSISSTSYSNASVKRCLDYQHPLKANLHRRRDATRPSRRLVSRSYCLLHSMIGYWRNPVITWRVVWPICYIVNIWLYCRLVFFTTLFPSFITRLHFYDDVIVVIRYINCDWLNSSEPFFCKLDHESRLLTDVRSRAKITPPTQCNPRRRSRRFMSAVLIGLKSLTDRHI